MKSTSVPKDKIIRPGSQSIKKELAITTDSRKEQWYQTYMYLLLIPIIVVLYVQVLWYDFTGIDDINIIVDKFFIIGDLSKIKLAFTTDAFLNSTGYFYRPLQTVSFMVEAFFSGTNPFAFHCTSILLHIAVCLAIYWFCIINGYKRQIAFIASLLYSVHPLFVSTVAWIPARGDQLLTLFSLLSFIYFIKYIRNKKTLNLILNCVTFFLALLSKETAAILPVLFLLYYWNDKKKTKTSLPMMITFWSALIFCWYELKSMSFVQNGSKENFGIGPFFQNIQTLPELFGKFIIPVHYSIIPHYQLIDTAIGIIAFVLFIVLFIKQKNNSQRRILFGFIWFSVFLVPVMFFRNSDAGFTFDYLYHRAYIAGIGLLLCIAEFIPAGWYTLKTRYTLVSTSLVVLFCAGTTLSNLRFYKEPVTLYTEAIYTNPKSVLPYNNRGIYYVSKNDYKNALSDFNNALAIFPYYFASYNNRGIVRYKTGDGNGALSDFTEAIRIYPHFANAYYSRANLYFEMHNYQSAMKDYDEVVKLNTLFPSIYSQRGGCKAMLGMPADALKDAELALKLDKFDYKAYNTRGLAHRSSGQLEQAMTDFDSALIIFPKYAHASNNRGTIWYALGNWQKAVHDYNNAILSDSTYAEAYSNRGLVRFKLNNPDSALQDLNMAIKLQPTFSEAYNNRGFIKRSMHLLDQAIADFDSAITFNPSYAQALENRGIVKNWLLRYTDAIIDFERAMQLQTVSADAWLGRGVARYNMNNHVDACRDWKQASALGSKEAESLLQQYCR